MDTAAKAHRVWCEQGNPCKYYNFDLSAEDWVVSIENKQISKHLEKEILDYIDQTTMSEFWNKKQRILIQHFPAITWDALEIAMKQTAQEKR